jgi:hypothetical protein
MPSSQYACQQMIDDSGLAENNPIELLAKSRNQASALVARKALSDRGFRQTIVIHNILD